MTNDTEGDAAAIRRLMADWIAASTAGDVDRLRTMMTEDVVFLTPGRSPFGRDEFLAIAMAQVGVVTIDGTADVIELQVLGDFAYARVSLKLELLIQKDQITRHLSGQTLSIYARGTDGCWRLSRDANLVAPV